LKINFTFLFYGRVINTTKEERRVVMEIYTEYQQKIIAAVKTFVKENFVNAKYLVGGGGPCLFIVACKRNGVDQLGIGVSTALRAALCPELMDLEWRCSGRAAAVRILDRCAETQSKLTPSWIILKKNMEQLWYNPSERPGDIGKIIMRSFIPMIIEKIRGSSANLVIYDDLPLAGLLAVLQDIKKGQGCSIVAVTVRESELSVIRTIMERFNEAEKRKSEEEGPERPLFTVLDLTVVLEKQRAAATSAWKSEHFKEELDLIYEDQLGALERDVEGGEGGESIEK
jgi:hypothetical protein